MKEFQESMRDAINLYGTLLVVAAVLVAAAVGILATLNEARHR